MIRSGLIAVVFMVMAMACEKIPSNSNWTSINKGNAEKCWDTNLASIRMGESSFDFDDQGPYLELTIVDSARQTLTFISDDYEANFDAGWVSFMDNNADIAITVETHYQGSNGTAHVMCEFDGSTIEIGTAKFTAK